MSNTEYKDKITMKFNIGQLDRIIVTLLNNGFNKKFAGNVQRLFKLFNPAIYKTDFEKEYRVNIVNEITEIIIQNNIENKNSILDFIDTDGKYYDASINLLNTLYEEEISDSELELLDRAVSNQLRYSAIMENAEKIQDKLTLIHTESYDDLEDAVFDLEKDIDILNKDIKSARESIEDSKHDLSLSSSGFVNMLRQSIQEDRNPAAKVKTGIQYLNTMLNGGFEKGRLYCAFGVAKG